MSFSKQLLLALALTIPFLFCGCWYSSEPKRRDQLEKQFRNDFGFVPPAEVTEIRCKMVRVGDSFVRWLSFRADTVTISRIVTNGFDSSAFAELEKSRIIRTGKSSPALIDPYEINPNAPKWWPDLSRVKFKQLYYTSGWSKSESAYTYFFINEANGLVFSHTAIWQ
jgi:hypothetical protein